MTPGFSIDDYAEYKGSVYRVSENRFFGLVTLDRTGQTFKVSVSDPDLKRPSRWYVDGKLGGLWESEDPRKGYRLKLRGSHVLDEGFVLGIVRVDIDYGPLVRAASEMEGKWLSNNKNSAEMTSQMHTRSELFEPGCVVRFSPGLFHVLGRDDREGTVLVGADKDQFTVDSDVLELVRVAFAPNQVYLDGCGEPRIVRSVDSGRIVFTRPDGSVEPYRIVDASLDSWERVV